MTSRLFLLSALAASAITCFAGNTAEQDEAEVLETFNHSVQIPQQYAWGTSLRVSASSAQIYIEGYQAGLIKCLKYYAKNIEHKPSESDKTPIGWPAFIDGFIDGFSAAEKMVQELKSKRGNAATSKIIKNTIKLFS